LTTNVPSPPADALANLLARGHAALVAGRIADAVRFLTDAIANTPTHAGAHHLLGLALERQGNARAALAAFLRVLELVPGSTDAAIHASALLLSFGDRHGAANCLLSAAAAAALSNPAEAGICRARALGLLERHDAAAAVLRAVLSQFPDHAEAWRLLGNTLSVAGAMDQARAAFRRAMESKPRDASAVLDLVRSGRIAEADRDLVNRIERDLAQLDASPRHQVLLGFALGKAYDDLGEPANAMRAFDRANAIRARLSPFDRIGFTTDVDRIIVAFPGTTPHHADAGRAIIIVGMPRSGTTLVEQILSCHPDVAAGGEMAFWGQWGTRWLAQGPADPATIRAEYAQVLDRVCATSARVTDKNPFNFAWLGLIRLVLPNATVIHCRRDPRDVCLSAYMTLFSGGNAWAANRDDLALFYRQYLRLMQHWRAVLPSQRLLEIDYEAIVADPAGAARQLVAFCGLDWNDACLRPEANPRPVHTASVYQAREAVHRRSAGRWRSYAPWLGALGSLPLPG
jgi:tetratricopeptide (TPR) repeat protein